MYRKINVSNLFSKKLSGSLIAPVIILFFSILGMTALLHPGLFTAHDIWHQVARLYYYSEAFKDGVFPPYWVSTLAGGFGYPLFFFSYHLPWILGIPFLRIGLDIPTTLKVLFFLSYLLSGLFMYLFAVQLLRNKLAATLSAIMYLWAPYHFLTIFVGASMGIVFVFTFLPVLLLGIYLGKDSKNFSIPVVALGLAGIILSHLEHVLFLSPIIFIFAIWCLIETKDKILFVRNMLFGLVLGVLLSAFYLIPAGYYNQFTKVHSETGFNGLYKRNFVNFSQLIYSKWGYGPIVNNAKNGEMSVQLGIAQWLSVLGVIFLIIIRKLKKNHIQFVVFGLISFIISIFLMLDFSLPIWQIIEKVTIADYPFRELLSITFLGSVFSGIFLVSCGRKLRYPVFALFIIVALYTNRNHVRVNLYTFIPVSSYIESEITTNSFNEYLPILADSKVFNQPMATAVGDDLIISNVKQNTHELSFTMDTHVVNNVSVKQFHFPGQTLYIDKNQADYKIDQQGRINFQPPIGSHNISVRFEETLIIKVSKALTLSGIIILLFLFVKIFKSRRK